MTTPPDKADEVLQAINHLLQALETLQVNSDRANETRDARVDAIENYIDALRAQVETQGNAIDAVVKSHEAQARQLNVLSDGITGLNSRMDKFDARMDRFESRMDGIDSRMDGFDSKLDGIRDDIGLVRGGHARNAMRQNLGKIVDQFGFKLVSPVPQESVVAWSKAVTSDNGISSGDADSFGNADMIANVLDSDGRPSYLALEASYTVANNDVRRAVRNAAYLNTMTGLEAFTAVAGVQVLPEVRAEIDAGQVRFYQIQARELQSE